MARKSQTKIFEEDMAINPEVENTKLAGRMDLLNSKLDDLGRNFSEKFLALNKKLEEQVLVYDRFVTKDEFARHVREMEERDKHLEPVIQWVKDRKAVEKFIYAIGSFIGVTNLVLLVKLITE